VSDKASTTEKWVWQSAGHFRYQAGMINPGNRGFFHLSIPGLNRPTAAPPRNTRSRSYSHRIPFVSIRTTLKKCYDPYRLPHPRHRVHPRHYHRVPLLPCPGQRVRRAGEERSRTLETRMHTRYPEGFRQPLSLYAEGQDLGTDGTAPAGVPILPG